MPLSIGKMFHVVHVAAALGPLDAFYDRVFAPRRGIMDGNYLPAEMRDGSLVAIADTVVETMAPADRPGARDLPVGRFFGRFGAHLHSLAWFTEDVGAIWDRLVDHGIRVVGPSGSAGSRPDEGDIYSHPRDTFTQLEFFQPPVARGGPHPPGDLADPRFDESWPKEWDGSPNPLGIERLSYATVLVRELAPAKRVFVDVLGGTVVDEGISTLTGTANTYVTVGPETVVELAVPVDEDSMAARDLASVGPSCHTAAYLVRDLGQVADHLASCGVGISARDDRTIMTERDQAFGVPFRFTVAPVPGDPRD